MSIGMQQPVLPMLLASICLITCQLLMALHGESEMKEAWPTQQETER